MNNDIIFRHAVVDYPIGEDGVPDSFEVSLPHLLTELDVYEHPEFIRFVYAGDIGYMVPYRFSYDRFPGEYGFIRSAVVWNRSGHYMRRIFYRKVNNAHTQ